MNATEAALRPQYSNCRYDKVPNPTRAKCTFSGPLRAGAAYETDGPVTAVVGPTAMHGRVAYHMYAAHNWPDEGIGTDLPDSAPRGTGAPLGLRTVDGSGDEFKTSGYVKSEMALGELAFDTDRTNDVQAIGFTIKGKVGEEVRVGVPNPRNGGEGDTRVTLPEGVSVVKDFEPGASEISYCRPADGAALCPWSPRDATELVVRIDERVEGARGTVTATSDPKADPKQDNNTAPVKVEYTD
ncbi:hypothetical protein SSP35_12_01700 [Streptomyces sp. NBRC 110611]|uniref:hypothetical protein n=1 Tax=Streptomyces sp. NBRC 110611 TaxID=1621259 RepID=UPI00082E7BB3|nr:hypothetical protein [Streptomyces sp. NBRC 110611]GAU69522.1 hypothetical protein SSP35_12_01700 [Streptomyces sp. NBRC 110611]